MGTFSLRDRLSGRDGTGCNTTTIPTPHVLITLRAGVSTLAGRGRTLTLFAWTPEDIKDRANKPMTNRNAGISPYKPSSTLYSDHFSGF